jgi:hypothetical protein
MGEGEDAAGKHAQIKACRPGLDRATRQRLRYLLSNNRKGSCRSENADPVEEVISGFPAQMQCSALIKAIPQIGKSGRMFRESVAMRFPVH